MPEITNHQKAEAVKRELAMRRKVYPRWVQDGRMTQAQADRQMEVFGAILADYQKLAAADAEARAPGLGL